MLLAVNFTLPPDELTIELWLQTVDSCHEGVPLSYAAPGVPGAPCPLVVVLPVAAWALPPRQQRSHPIAPLAPPLAGNALALVNYQDWRVEVLGDAGGGSRAGRVAAAAGRKRCRAAASSPSSPTVLAAPTCPPRRRLC